MLCNMNLTQLRPAFWALPLLATTTVVLGLQVAPGSPCAHNCLGSSSDNNWSADASKTNSSEITCSDAAYADSKVGIKYKQCVECLRTSSRGNWGETDAKWFVYNLRYALDVCLYNSPEADPPVPTSPCADNQGCKNLKSALAGDQLVPTQNISWNYCFRDDGVFMGSNRTSCRDCLRETKDQIYMANFLTALEAGCRQTPEKGTVIGLSGTVFTSQQVNITDPESPPPEDHASLSTGAIVGIAIGVVVSLSVAVALLLVYCKKHRVEENWEDYFDDNLATPQRRGPPQDSTALRNVQYIPTQPEAVAKLPRAQQRGNSGPAKGSEERPPVSSGHYSDSIERHLPNSGHISPAKEPNAAAARPDGSRYDDRSISRVHSRTTTRGGSPTGHREPSPPASVHRHVRSNTPDSFAVQAYLDAAAESARMATAAAEAAAAAGSPTGSSSASTKRRSILSLLSLSKLGGGRSANKSPESSPVHPGYILQPRLTSDKAFHGDKNISRPILAREEPRFLDTHTMSSTSPSVSRAPKSATSPKQTKYIEYKEVPLRDGNSALWD